MIGGVILNLKRILKIVESNSMKVDAIKEAKRYKTIEVENNEINPKGDFRTMKIIEEDRANSEMELEDAYPTKEGEVDGE